MLKFGNKEFRNLQEQVLANMRAIGDLKTTGIVLDEFGIKVVGQESSAASMPTVAAYKEAHEDWSYGDAYAIGTESPYDLYILTRANESHSEDYWFNVGEFPAPGPQGPAGETGPAGPQGQTGAAGQDGISAGFGTIIATATTLEPSESATASVVASGSNMEKNLTFTFGIPRGANGEAPELEWGNITGNLAAQTDLLGALQAKQNALVSGANIKTINNQSILGSGNIDIQSGGGDVTDVEVNGTSVVDENGVAEIDLSGYATTSDISDMATETWVGQQGYITGITSSDVITALGYTPGTSNFSGDYDDLTDKPTIPTKVSDLTNDSGYITSSALSGYATETWVGQQGYAVAANLATVATTGAYSDLSGTPDLSDMATKTWVGNQGYLTSVSWSDVSGKPTFATVATSGSYNDLTDKPTIPVVDYPVTDVTVGGTSVLDGKVAKIPALFSGDYDDLTDKPDLSVYALSSSLATVATSGSYNDLSNKPTIPAAQVNSDWNASTGVAKILNKPSLATVATSGSYNDLSNKPTIPTVSNATITVKQSGIADQTFKLNGSATTITLADTTYSEATTSAAGLMSAADKTKLNGIATGAEVNVQANWTETNSSSDAYIKNKPSLATVATSGSYTDLSNKPTIPTTTSQLTNNSGYITKSVNNLTNYTLSSALAAVATSGSYVDLSNKPTITLSETIAASPDYSLNSIIINGDTWGIPEQHLYVNGDTYSNAAYINPSGYITGGSKEISFTFVAPKSLKNITSITVNKLQCVFRGVGGYVNGSSMTNYAADSNYTITATKIDDHNIFVQIKATTAFISATNNTPVNAAFNANYLQLTFNA